MLLAIGGYVLQSRAVDDDAGALHFLQYFQEEKNSILVGSTIVYFGLAALMWFLVYLRARYARAEAGAEHGASLAFAGGLGAVLLLFGSVAPLLAGAIHASNKGRILSAGTSETLITIGDGFVIAAEFSWLVFMAASAVLILRTGLLPRWMGWLSIGLAVLLAVPPVGWAALLYGSPIWIVLTSLLLYWSGRAELNESPVLQAEIEH